jgi:lysophospholipase L1-like esterase
MIPLVCLALFVSATDVTDAALREELLARVKLDQAARMKLIDAGNPPPPKLLDAVQEADDANRAWLKGVIEERDWPGKSLVGEDGAHAAWLLVQHADADLPFQKKCLELLEVAVKQGEATGTDLAYLTDRVLAAEGRKQRYGTQLEQKDGRFVPKPTEDPEGLDARRQELGLMPMAEYVASAERMYKLKPATPARQPDIEIDPRTAKVDPETGVHWYDIRPLGVEGQGWTDTKAPFDRLPAKAEQTARPPVWDLSRDSTGLCVRFVTGATSIHARWTVTSKDLAMPHMPATGVSGLDLYVKNGAGKWRWVANGRPTAETTTDQLAAGLAPGEKEYLLYLPLYNGVSAVEIGLPKDTALKRADPRPADRQAPIVFYGTSITQGGCASRPGMVHTAILGRTFDRPVINLGFSGNGTLDPDIAALLGELDAAVFVLDCLPNLTAAQVAERTEPFVRVLRKARPMTPILLVEDRTYANAPVLSTLAKRNADSRAAYKKAFDALVAAGDPHLFYLAGDHLIGDDGEGTVDGSHPTDLGFMRQAEVFAEALRPLLSRKK